MVMVIQTIGAFCAVASFTRILELPRRFVGWYGTAGALCWLVYLTAKDAAGSKIFAAFLASLAVAVFSHVAARVLKAPVTVFLISGIFPLVPGAGVYWTVYYMVTDQLYLAVQTGYTAVKVAVAIVLGIVFVFELPQGLFRALVGRRR